MRQRLRSRQPAKPPALGWGRVAAQRETRLRPGRWRTLDAPQGL